MLKSIQVLVHVPLATALARGEAEWGETEVTLINLDIAKLTEEGKAALARAKVADAYPGRLIVGGGSLTVSAATATDAVAAINAVGAKRLADEAASAATREAGIQKLLAAPPSEWVRYNGSRVFYVADDNGFALRSGFTKYEPCMQAPSHVVYVSDIDNDPRVTARQEEVRRTFFAQELLLWEKQYEVWQTWCEEENKRQDNRKALKEARKRVIDDELRQYAIRNVPAIARAAQEGYPFESEALDALARDLIKHMPSGVVDRVIYTRIDDAPYDRVKDARAPGVELFALHAAVTAAATEASKTFSKHLGYWVVSRIVYVDVATSRDDSEWHDVVLAQFETSAGDIPREVIFALDPLPDGDNAWRVAKP